MTTTIERIEDTYERLPQYAVLVDGERVGVVYRSTFSWSRKAPGCRYSYAEGIGITWRYSGGAVRESGRYDTRKQAVAEMLRVLNLTTTNA